MTTHEEASYMAGAILFYIAWFILGAVTIKHRMLSFAVATVGYILALIEVLARQLTGEHISYFILSRIDITMLEMATVVVPHYVYGGIAITALILYGQYRLIKKMHKTPIKKRVRIALPIITILILALSTTTKAYVETCRSASKIWEYQDMALAEVKEKLSLGGYMDKRDIKACAGKNIVVIYLESFENNFLDETNFPLEMTNIHRLQQQGWHTYDNYDCVYGAEWTIGSLYATQTGLPTMFSGKQNRAIFNVQAATDAISYTSVLKQAGYQCIFLSNSYLEFGGTGSMMCALGYETIGGETFPEGAPKTRWGVHDVHGFAKAKEEYIRLSKSGQPFQLTLLTVDTHFPNGFPDETMRPHVDTRIPSGSHEYVVATLDYLVGDFVRFIESQPNGKDTVIVLMSDHLMMQKKNERSIIDKLDDTPRHNLLMTNHPIPNHTPADNIAFWHIPSIMLDLAEVKHNVTFPVDMNGNMSEQYIKDNESLFTIFNIKLLK